jgi:hypothetical protein
MSSTGLKIEFSDPKPYYSSKENLDIGFYIFNDTERKIYFVKELQYITFSSELPVLIEIGFALRKPTDRILTYYKFSPPPLQEIDVRHSINKHVEIPIPLQTTHVDENHQIIFKQMPMHGKFNVQIVLGYGFDLAISQCRNPLQSFLEWQKLIESPKLEITID